MKKIFSLLTLLIMTSVMVFAQSDADINITCYDCTTDWYEALWIDYSDPHPEDHIYNGWNIILKGNQGENIIVCILDMDNVGELVDGRTYTEAEIVTNWSGVRPYGQQEDISQDTGITYTQHYDDSGKLHVTLDMTGLSGKTYHVTYDEKCDIIGDIQELQFDDTQVSISDNTSAPGIQNFQIIASKPGEVSMMVAVNSDKLAGSYTMNDVINDFSDITWGDTNSGEYSVLKFCDMEMTVTEDSEREGAYYFDITIITKVGYAYHTVLHTTPWERPDVEITSTETITASNLRMMDYRDSWGELLFVASSPEHSVCLYAHSKERHGTFGRKEIDFPYNYVWYWEGETEKQANGIDGEYTYTEDENGNRSLTGWLDCDNGVHYILDLHYDHPQATRTVEVTTSDYIIDDQRTPDGGGIIIEAIGDSQYILIGIYTPEIEGTYTEQDMDWQTTYVVENDNDNENESDIEDGYMLELLDGKVVVYENENENYFVDARITLQAEQNKEDIVEYIIHMRPEGTIDGVDSVTKTITKTKTMTNDGRILIHVGNRIYNTQGIEVESGEGNE